MPYKDPAKAKARRKAYQATHRVELNAKARARHAANPEKRNETTRIRRRANPEKHRAHNATYYAKHPEVFRLKHAKLRAAQPELFQAYWARRRASKRGVRINDLSTAQIQEIKQAAGFLCAYCGKKFPANKLTIDHIIPLIAHGDNTLHNVTVACKSCNSKKHTGPPLKQVQPLLLTIALPKKKKDK